MSKHNTIGTNGELFAKKFLEKKGYHILAQNWRWGKKEIDIIAESQDCIVFIEVKTRSNIAYGYPEEAVSEKKKNFLKEAASAYYEQNLCDKMIRFDIISILLNPKGDFEIVHLEDSFY